LGTSPFQALYGHSPCTFGNTASDASPVSSFSVWLAERNMMQQLIQKHLSHAQQRMKRQVDKHRYERSFQGFSETSTICAVVSCYMS
jgi:hypothetical protein